MSNYFDAYLEAKVDSASPLQLVHLAYESAIASVCEAREHLEKGLIPERSRAITRATRILVELSESLDYKAAREMSVRLGSLYDYMMDRLREANFQQTEAPLLEVEGLLRTVGESWSAIAAAETESERMPGTAGKPENSSWTQPVEAPSYYQAAYTR